MTKSFIITLILTIFSSISEVSASEKKVKIVDVIINDLREYTYKIERVGSRVVHPKTKEDELWAFAVQQMYSTCESLDEMAPLLISKDHDSSSLEFNFECEPWELRSKRPAMAEATCRDLKGSSVIKSACELERKSKRKYLLVAKPHKVKRMPAIQSKRDNHRERVKRQ